MSNVISDEKMEAQHHALLDAVSEHFVQTDGLRRGITLSSRENEEDAVMLFALSVPLADADEMFDQLRALATQVATNLELIYSNDEDEQNAH